MARRKPAPAPPAPPAPEPSPSVTAVFLGDSVTSEPRADGAVQHRGWNAWCDAHNAPPWAGRWMFIQDTYVHGQGKITEQQADNLAYNFGNARTMLGMIQTGAPGVTLVGDAWIAYAVPAGQPPSKRVEIPDAVAFAADFRAPGHPFSPGTWAADLNDVLFAKWLAQGYWLNENPPSTPFPIA